MDLTDGNETIASLFARSISQKTRAKKSLDNSNEDYSDSLRMGDKDIMVFPGNLLKLKSQKSKSKVDDVIRKTSNDKVLNLLKEVQPAAPGFSPTFVKIMSHSHVAGSFWLNLPKTFAKLHLPEKDATLTLEDDDGKEYDVNYLWTEAALSAGWRGFSIAHKLSKGDKLVFQLVKALKFKVHIVRLGDLNGVDEASEDFMVSKRKADMHCEDLEMEVIEVDSWNDELKNSASITDNDEDYLDSLMMEDEDIRVLPHKLRKQRSQKGESKADREISKTSNNKGLKQTKEVQPSGPTFVKIMVHSNVAGSFWLHLPNNFCDLHLPKKDVIVTLEDNDGVEYHVKYLWAKAALSGGWRGFSMAHKLSKGDKLVFQLVKPLKFKVHIIRLDDVNKADGALKLVMSNSSSKDLGVSKRKAEKHYVDLEVEIIEDHQKDEHGNSPFNVEKINDNTSSPLSDFSDGAYLQKSFKTDIIKLDDSNLAHGMLNSSSKEVKSGLRFSKRKTEHSEDLEVHITEDHSHEDELKNFASNIDHIRKIDDNTSTKEKADKQCEDLEVQIIEGHSQKDELKNFVSNIDHVRKKDDGTRFPLPETLQKVHLPKSTSANFEDVRSIENFVIAVHDVVIDSAVPEYVRTKYYELCRSQKSYLHIHLLKSFDSLLLSAGITSETVMVLSARVISAIVDIADAIQASTVTTLLENFAIWEQNLKQFEKLGMNVGFLVDRLIQLRDLAQKSKRCLEAKIERIKAEENKRILESRILEVKEEINRLNTEVTILNPNDDNLIFTFKEVANAAW